MRKGNIFKLFSSHLVFMSEKDDKLIVQEVLKGNTMAFEELIERYQAKVYTLSLRMTGVPEDAEDITQNVFIRIFSGLSNYNPDYKFFSWLYKTALNETINHIKSNKFKKQHKLTEFPDHKNAENDLINEEKNLIIRHNINMLKPKYKSLIILKYYEQYSYDEISEITGLSVKKVKSRLYEARNVLRNSLITQL
jgi:RNA polymerase sigma-70 factor (ECF subfamily)